MVKGAPFYGTGGLRVNRYYVSQRQQKAPAANAADALHNCLTARIVRLIAGVSRALPAFSEPLFLPIEFDDFVPGRY